MDFHAIPFILTPYLGAFPGIRIVYRNMDWYDTLNRPKFCPPKWVFGPVLIALYASMGTASYLIWRDGTAEETGLPLVVYGASLITNWCWTPVFFGCHKLKTSVAVILATLGGAITCAVLFRPINKMASNLMIPYALWLSYESAVNISIALNN